MFYSLLASFLKVRVYQFCLLLPRGKAVLQPVRDGSHDTAESGVSNYDTQYFLGFVGGFHTVTVTRTLEWARA